MATEAQARKGIIETIARGPEVLEDGLQIADTNVITLGKESIDLIGIDKDQRVFVGIVSAKAQDRSARDGNIIEKGVNNWHWVTDYREEFVEGIRRKLDTKTARQAPRLLVVAPDFDEGLRALAAGLATRIDVTLLRYEVGAERAEEVPSGDASDAKDAWLKRVFNFHASRVEEQVEQFPEHFDDENPVRSYQAVTLDQHIERVAEQLRPDFERLVSELERLELRVTCRPNHLYFTNAAGEEVCEVTLGPGGAYSLTARGNGKQQFGPEEIDPAVETVSKLAGKSAG